MSYKGQDAPRGPLQPDGSRPLIWNTDYGYSEQSGVTVNQSVRQAYPQALATLRDLIATAKANKTTEVNFSYSPGGYCVLTQRNRANDVNADGSIVQNPANAISSTWSIEGLDEQISIWSHQPVVDLLSTFTTWGAHTGLSVRDMKVIWRGMVDAYAAGQNSYELQLGDGSTEIAYLSETILLNYFDGFSGGASAPGNKQLAAEIIRAMAEGHETVSRASYVVMNHVQVPLAYTGTGNLYAGVDKYWTTTQVAAAMPPGISLPPIVGKWLKKAPTQHYRTGSSMEFQVRWEQDRNPNTVLYPDN